MAFLVDTFVEATDTGLADHVGEVGAAWTDHPHANYTANFTVDAATDRLWGGGTAAYYASGIPPSADYSIEADFYLHSAISQNVAICVRMDTTADTMVIARLNNGTTWEVRELIDGDPATLGSSGNQLPSEGTSKRGRLEARGNQAYFYVEGVLEIGPVTLTITSAGRAGVRNAGAASATTGIHLDNLAAASLNAGAALFRGRNFPFFDDEEVNRFEFWPSGTDSSELVLTTSDNVDNLADSEAHVLGIMLGISDALEPLTDVRQLLLGHLLAFSDSAATLTDAAELQLEHREEFADSVVLTDTSALLLGHELALADNADTLTDAYAQQLQSNVLELALDDALSLSDLLALGHGLLTSGALSLSDAYDAVLAHLVEFDDVLALTDDETHTLGYGELLADAISLSDEQSQQLGHLLEFTDSIDSLSDDHTLLLVHLLSLSDSHALTDATALLLVYLLTLSDDANLLADSIEADAPQTLREVSAADSIDTLADAAALQLDHLLVAAESIALTDATALTVTHHLTLDDNAANWADSVAFTYGLALILNDNAVVLSDDFTALFTHALALTDSFTLSDSLTTLGEHFLQAADSFVLSDDFDVELRGPEFTVVFEDVLVLSDAVSLSLANELQYQIVLTDTIVLTDHYFDLRRPYTPSAKRHIVVPSRARETVVTGERATRVPTSSRMTKVT